MMCIKGLAGRKEIQNTQNSGKKISKRKQSKAKFGSRQFEDKKTYCCQKIQRSAIWWINAIRPPALYRDRYTMRVAYWMSGKDPKFQGHLIPSYSTVYNLLQRNKAVPDSIHEIPAISADCRNLGGSPADIGGSPSFSW